MDALSEYNWSPRIINLSGKMKLRRSELNINLLIMGNPDVKQRKCWTRRHRTLQLFLLLPLPFHPIPITHQIQCHGQCALVQSTPRVFQAPATSQDQLKFLLCSHVMIILIFNLVLIHNHGHLSFIQFELAVDERFAHPKQHPPLGRL